MHTDIPKPDTEAAEALAEWRAAVDKEHTAFQATAAKEPPDPNLERAYGAAMAHTERLAYQAWARPVCGAADLHLRAEIAKHALWTDYEDSEGRRRFDDVLLGSEPRDALAFGEFDERAVAELVKAALWTLQAPSPRPDILESRLRDKIETVGQGLSALHTLVHTHRHDVNALDTDLGISLVFCIDALQAVSEELDKLVESIEVRPRAPA